MSTSKVLIERVEHTQVVTINRPEVRNCVDGETAQGLFEAAQMFRNDNELYVMIITGAGDPSAGSGQAAFCSGADLKNAGTLMTRPEARDSGPMGFTRISEIEKPVIAAVNGYCTAGGLEIACWADFRIASRNAQFGVLNRRWGVPLVDGGTQRLPRIVGLGNALYLIETGALIDAGYALRMGLVQELVPEGQALERALVVADAMSKVPQKAMRFDRKAALEGLSMPLPEAISHEAIVHRDTSLEPEMAQWLQRYAAGDRPAPFRPA